MAPGRASEDRGRQQSEPSPQGPSPGRPCREGKTAAPRASGQGLLLAFLSERTFPFCLSKLGEGMLQDLRV